MTNKKYYVSNAKPFFGKQRKYASMMYLEERALIQLRNEAARNNVSLASVIRKAIDFYLSSTEEHKEKTEC